MTRDIAAVALGLAVAALALSEALGLPIGTLRSPGQGFFPLWLGVLLLALSLVLLPQTLRARRGPAAGRQPHRTGGRSRGRARRLHRGPGSDRLSDRHLLPRALHGEDHAPAALAARARNLAARRRRLVSALRRVAEGAAAAGLMEILSLLGSGFAIALTPENLFYCFVGSLVGTAIGVLPGLGPPATIALLLPVTYGIPATSAVILLAGIFYGAMYGGSTTPILRQSPGEAASVVTCLDGYQMARQGRAGAALAVAALGSFIAGPIRVVRLTPPGPPP